MCADAEKINTVGNQTHQSRTDKDTRHCADTAAQRAASEYDGGDGVYNEPEPASTKAGWSGPRPTVAPTERSMPPLMITSP